MVNEKHTIDGFGAGVALSCAQANIDVETLIEKAAAVNAALQSVEVQSALAKIASAIFTLAGPEFEKEASFYHVISEKKNLLRPYGQAMFIEPVLSVLQQENMSKSAATGAATGFLSNLIGSGIGKAVPFGLKTLSTLGVLGGLGLGALHWALNRDITEDDLETEMKLEQARHYRRIAKDIQRSIDLKSAGNKESADLKKQLKEESDASYVL